MQSLFFIAFLFLSVNVIGQSGVYHDLGQVDDPNKVTHLYLDKQKLKSFPEEILSFQNLVFLDLSKNKIESLPSELHRLTHLKHLYLSKNKISDIRPITGLQNLEVLHLDRNPVQVIPPSFGNLRNLTVFDCWQCALDTLPIEMKELSKLEEVDLRQTFIRQQDAGEYYKWWPNAKVHTTWGCNCGQP